MLLLACAALAATPQPAGKSIEVKVLDHRTGEPLPGLPVEVTSSVPIPCLQPPCPPSDQTRWRGRTDEQGVLAYPASLDEAGAVVYVRAVGSDFAVDVHGEGRRDARGRPVLLLEPPGRAPMDVKDPLK